MCLVDACLSDVSKTYMTVYIEPHPCRSTVLQCNQNMRGFFPVTYKSFTCMLTLPVWSISSSQHLDYNHWYDRTKLTLKEIHNVQYVACMNPTAGSFTINSRLQRHFSVFAISFPGMEALKWVLSLLSDLAFSVVLCVPSNYCVVGNFCERKHLVNWCKIRFWIATKPRNLRIFSPSNFSCYASDL